MTFLEFLVLLIASPVIGALLYGTYQFNHDDLERRRSELVESKVGVPA